MGKQRFVAAAAAALLFALAVLVFVSCSSSKPTISDTVGNMDASYSPVPETSTTGMMSKPDVQSTTGSEPVPEAAPDGPQASDAADSAPASDAADASDGPLEANVQDAPTCDGGLTSCNDVCVNTQLDPLNCGGCSQACDPGALCIMGTCECLPGQMLCSKRCVDPTTDATNCHDCGHSCQGGTCVAGVCQPSVVYSPTSVVDIAVDATNVYWTTGGSSGNVLTKPFSGGMPSLVSGMGSIVGTEDNPRGIAKDPRDLNHLYWVDLSSGAVNYVLLVSGTPSQTGYYRAAVPTGQPSPGPNDVVIDGKNIYWVDQAVGTVNQLPLSMPGGAAPTVLASGRSQPRSLAVDPSYVYWVDFGNTNNTGSVNKVPIGGNDSQVVALATAENQPYDIVVDHAGAYVYWTTHADRLSGGSVRRIATTLGDGGVTAPTILAVMQGSPDGIALDPYPNEQFVYWTAYVDGTVMKLPVAGGTTPFQMANNQNNPTAIAVDTDNVYWASEGNMAILKVAK